MAGATRGRWSAPGCVRASRGRSPRPHRPCVRLGDMSGSEQLRGVWRSERPFVVAFALAAVVRGLLMVAFPPGSLMRDGPPSLGFVDDLFPSPDRPVGYGVYLRVLSWATRAVELVSATQL